MKRIIDSGINNMGRIYHFGYKAYALMAVVGYVAISFVSPETANEITTAIHSLVVAFTP